MFKTELVPVGQVAPAPPTLDQTNASTPFQPLQVYKRVWKFNCNFNPCCIPLRNAVEGIGIVESIWNILNIFYLFFLLKSENPTDEFYFGHGIVGKTEYTRTFKYDVCLAALVLGVGRLLLAYFLLSGVSMSGLNQRICSVYLIGLSIFVVIKVILLIIAIFDIVEANRIFLSTLSALVETIISVYYLVVVYFCNKELTSNQVQPLQVTSQEPELEVVAPLPSNDNSEPV